MPEAVIVATARSPIGRAGKGSLKGVRPDDLAVDMVQAALGKVPELDPRDIDDLIINSLQWHDKHLGLETMCVGGGHGTAMVLERLS